MFDLHTHTTYSDGKHTPREMIQHAIQLGIKKIAITDHMPLPFEDPCAMPRAQLEAYREEVSRLKQEFSDHIEVLLGLEFDYLPNHLPWLEEILSFDWDWKIGSIHFFHLPKASNPVWVDGTTEEFEHALQEYFGNDIQALCGNYFHALQQTIQTGYFDLVGHLDLVKKNNAEERFFQENAPWYVELVEQTLQLIQKQSLTVEINTAGLYKPVQQSYPSYWIIQRCQELNIPLIYSSDAHQKDQLIRDFTNM